MSILAQQLIEKNLRSKDPYLDLGNCGLKGTEDELYSLLAQADHLEVLILSNKWNEYIDNEGRWISKSSSNTGKDNRFIQLPAFLPKKLKSLVFDVLKDKTWKEQDYSFIMNLLDIKDLNLSNHQIQDISFLSELPQLKTLDLRGNKIHDVSPLINLANLASLNLSSNQIQDLSSLRNKTQLKALEILGNKVTDFSFLKNLKQLLRLNLSGYTLSDTSFLNHLEHLQSLELGNTEISQRSLIIKGLNDLTELRVFYTELKSIQLSNLKSIQHLEFSTNGLEKLELKNLPALQSLNLSNNNFNEYTFLMEVPQLKVLGLRSSKFKDLNLIQSFTQLQQLDISNNQIQDISLLKDLKELEKLEASDCQVQDVSVLSNLRKLSWLDLSRNQIQDICPLRDLVQLKWLLVSGNLIRDVTCLKSLEKLIWLDLSRNQVQDCSFLKGLSMLETLNLTHNPIHNITLDLLNSLPSIHDFSITNTPFWELRKEFFSERSFVLSDIRNYLLAQAEGNTINTEAKVIWFGNAEAGKTTLSHQLRYNEFQHQKHRTHGIVISDWVIDYENFPQALKNKIEAAYQKEKEENQQSNIEIPESITIKMWDFGGQEYYHATHPLFLSSNLLYFLVWELKTDYYNEQEGVYPKNYWQKNIMNYAPQNITIEIQNKVKEASSSNHQNLQYKIEHRSENDQRSIQKYELDIKELEEGIFSQLHNLENLGTLFPKIYNDIREAIRKEGQPFLKYKDYKHLCQTIDLTKNHIMQSEEQIRTLTNFLHDTGSVICYRYHDKFKNYTALKNYVFIKPTWVTDIIYRILSQNLTQKRGGLEQGEFDVKHIETALKTSEMLSQLLPSVWIELMNAFEVIFEIKKRGQILYVAPQYLPMSCSNHEALEWALDCKPIYCFSLHYPKFLSRSIFLRFIAQYGSQSEKFLYWKAGLFFRHKGKGVYVICNYEQRTITVQIESQNEVVAQEILSFFLDKGNENTTISIDKEDFVSLSRLKEKIHNNFIEIETTEGKTLKVKEFAHLFENTHTTMRKKKIHIFISYSSKDRELKQTLQTGLQEHLSITEDFEYEIWSDKAIDIGENWKEEIEKSLAKSEVALLLVSASFASSKFINQEELPAFFKKKKEDGLLIMPVLLRKYNIQNFENLSTLQFFKTYHNDYGFSNHNEKDELLPFDKLGDDEKTTKSKLNDYFYNLTEFIHRAVEKHYGEQTAS